MKPTDYLFKTVRIKKPIFEDGYLDKGMIGRIEAVRDKESDMWEIVFNLKDFHQHNLKHEERNYWGRDGKANLTATEAGDYPKNHIDSYYFMKDEDLGDYVEIVDENLYKDKKVISELEVNELKYLLACAYNRIDFSESKSDAVLQERIRKALGL